MKIVQWNQKWQGHDNNMHNELSCHVPHGAVRGIEIVSNQTPKADRTRALYSYLTVTVMRVLCGHKKTNDSRANIRKQSHEKETTKSTRNCPFAARVVFTYLDTRLLTVLLYLGIAQFAKRRSCRAQNSLQINIGGQLDA